MDDLLSIARSLGLGEPSAEHQQGAGEASAEHQQGADESSAAYRTGAIVSVLSLLALRDNIFG